VEIVRLLLAAGADPNVKNASGKTPVDVAKNPKVAQELRKSQSNAK
jgi:ankyrin repeat protein